MTRLTIDVDETEDALRQWAKLHLSTPQGRIARAILAALLDPEPPVGSVVLDCDGDAWQRHGDEWLYGGGASMRPHAWAELNEKCGPLRVIYTPEVEQ